MISSKIKQCVMQMMKSSLKMKLAVLIFVVVLFCDFKDCGCFFVHFFCDVVLSLRFSK